jgi:hypothetical protein
MRAASDRKLRLPFSERLFAQLFERGATAGQPRGNRQRPVSPLAVAPLLRILCQDRPPPRGVIGIRRLSGERRLPSPPTAVIEPGDRLFVFGSSAAVNGLIESGTNFSAGFAGLQSGSTRRNRHVIVERHRSCNVD